MAKKQSRAKRIMTDSLTTKLDTLEEDERDTLYTPVKNTKFDFFDAIGDAIDTEKEVMPSTKKKVSSGWILGVLAVIVVIVVLAVVIDGILL